MVAIPLTGLAIDLGSFYLVQSKLQAAVDAGALAGARSLARGDNSGAQIANAQATASSMVNANFPGGYLNTSSLSVPTPVVSINAATATRSVTTTASVQVPHMFFLWFSSSIGSSSLISVSATATRRDVNVILVMDRSGSLATSGACTPLKNAASGFVSRFAEGRDFVGLVTYATSYKVDVAMSQTFKSAVAAGIAAISCSGSTSTAAGLWLGYQTLAALNQPAALNVILLFTDGEPTSVTADFAIKSTSACSNHSNRTGVITTASNEIRGIMSPVPATPIASNDAVVVANSSNCAYAQSWQNNRDLVGSDITGIPNTDVFGNQLTYNYRAVSTSGGLLAAGSTSTNSTNFMNGAYNAAAHAANRIRSGASPGNGSAAVQNVVIFAIGLGGAGAASDDFLQMVANDPANTTYYNSAQMPGLYVYANNYTDLANAFNRVASEILRIAH